MQDKNNGRYFRVSSFLILITFNKIDFFHSYIIWNIQVLFCCFFNLLGENKLVNSASVLLITKTFVDLIQKYPHIIESYPCIL